MPFTEKQRRLFHAEAEKEHPDGMSHRTAEKLADEADRLKKEGKEKRPIEKSDNFIDLRHVW